MFHLYENDQQKTTFDNQSNPIVTASLVIVRHSPCITPYAV